MTNKVYFNVLKDAQSQSKQREFGISLSDYPKYSHDVDDLDYYCISLLLECANKIIDEQSVDQEELQLCCDYFGSSTNIEKKSGHIDDYLLFASASNFLRTNFGNTKVFISQFSGAIDSNNIYLAYFLSAVSGLRNKALEINEEAIEFSALVENYLFKDGKADKLLEFVNLQFEFGMSCRNVKSVIFNKLLLAIIILSKSYVSSIILEKYSGFSFLRWKSCFSDCAIPPILWESQIEVAKAGGFLGESLIIQSPTGSGKTKSIQLLLASKFIRNQKLRAVVLSPLRSLCNEIANDLALSFSNIRIAQTTDVVEDNIENLGENYVVVLTPEKFEYLLFHSQETINLIDTIVIDEGHLVEDSSRGALFELLLSQLAPKLTDKTVIFISAVLKNADSISKWLFRDKEHSVLSGINFPTTNKNISKYDNDVIYFYTPNNLEKHEYYVVKSVKTKELLRFGRERKTRLFPEKNVKDLSIYYAFLLSKYGGAAIFFKNKRSIISYLKRIADVNKRGMNYAKISSESFTKLKKLVAVHYGENDYFDIVESGVCIHYATLEEGLKKASEYYIKQKISNIIMCTSTLSEGVNLPIKYLIITDLNRFTYDITTREIINLVGRTGRNGQFSEGTILVTTKVDKQGFKNIFDKNNIEELKSTFDLLVSDDVCLGYNLCAKSFYDKIIAYLSSTKGNSRGFTEAMISSFEEYCNIKKHDEQTNAWAKKELEKYCNRVETAIDSLSLFISNYVSQKCPFDQFVEEIINNLFIVCNKNDNTKERITSLCKIIFDFASDSLKDCCNYTKYPFAKFDLTLYLSEWNSNNKDLLISGKKEEYFDCLLREFYTYFKMNVSIADFKGIYKKWIDGATFIEISKAFNIDIYEIENICRNTLSYSFSSWIGNLRDIFEEYDDALAEHQKRVKYGLKNKTAIDLYESGLTDRYLSTVLSSNKTPEEALEFLDSFPVCFKEAYLNIGKK